MEVVKCDDDFDSSHIAEKLEKSLFDVKEAFIFDFKEITQNSTQNLINSKKTESIFIQKFFESNGTFKSNITDLKLNSLDSLKSNVIIPRMAYGRNGGFRNDNQ